MEMCMRESGRRDKHVALQHYGRQMGHCTEAAGRMTCRMETADSRSGQLMAVGSLASSGKA